MNCVLGSSIWSVLLYLNNYCIKNVKPQNMLSDHGKENNFSAMVCVIPYRLLDISVQEHINMQPQAAAFLWLVAHLW